MPINSVETELNERKGGLSDMPSKCYKITKLSIRINNTRVAEIERIAAKRKQLLAKLNEKRKTKA